MAYYDDDDDDGYMWPQEHTTYDLVDHQDSVSFSGFESYDLDTYDAYIVSEFHEPKFIDHYHYHHPHDRDHDYDYDHSFSSAGPAINYCAYDYVEPKLIAYELAAYDTGYVHSSISYSKVDSGFNEPEFEEYDPTPYGGGYDIVSVYGKPLPPSDQTCYPRSNPNPIEPTPRPMPEPMSTIPLVEPEPKLKPEPAPAPAPAPAPLVEPEPEPEPLHVPVPMAEPLELREVEEKEREEYSYPDYGYDYPWPEYGIGVGYDYGYGKQVVQVPPCEYNPEVVDLCVDIFGNWPCLAKIREQQMDMDNKYPEISYPDNGHHDPWEECANYIFGGPIASYNQWGYGHGCEE